MFKVREDSYDAMERFMNGDTAQTKGTVAKADTTRDESELKINEYISLNSSNVLPLGIF